MEESKVLALLDEFIGENAAENPIVESTLSRQIRAGFILLFDNVCRASLFDVLA